MTLLLKQLVLAVSLFRRQLQLHSVLDMLPTRTLPSQTMVSVPPVRELWTWSLIVLIFAFILIFYLRNRRKYALLGQIPHGGVPIIGIAYQWFRNGDLLEVAEMVCRKFEGICVAKVLTEEVVAITKPEYLRTFYTSRNVDKADFYAPLQDIVGNLPAVSSNGQNWKAARKMLHGQFFNVHQAEFLKSFKKCGQSTMLNNFRAKADGGYFSCVKGLQDAICLCLFDHAFDSAPTSDFTDEVIGNMSFVLKMVMMRSKSALYYFKPIFRLTNEGRKFFKCIDSAQKIAGQLAADKIKHFLELKKNDAPVPTNVFLYNLMDNYPEKTQHDIANEIIHMVYASVDTTSKSIGFALNMLGLHQDVQEQVLQEYINQRKPLEELTVDDLLAMDYIDSVVKETLRLFPVAPIIGRKLIEDTWFGKYLIPAGTNVMAYQKLTNLDEELFENSRTFNPDRFSPENAKNIQQYSFNPFSSGPRGCPGMKYGNLSMKFHILAVVKEFKIYSILKDDEEALNNCSMEFTSTDRKNFTIRLETRTK